MQEKLEKLSAPIVDFFSFFVAVSLSNDVTTMYCHLLTTQWTNCFDSNRHMTSDWWSRFDKKKTALKYLRSCHALIGFFDQTKSNNG